jgi:YD repeat-containing protein
VKRGRRSETGSETGTQLVFCRSTTDRDGRRTDTAYDALGRPTAVTWYDTGGAVTDTAIRSYDADDPLLTATDHTGVTTVAFAYDSLGRVATRRGPFVYGPDDKIA